MRRQPPGIAGAAVRRPESSSMSPSVPDALAAIHQRTLELIVHGAAWLFSERRLYVDWVDERALS